MKYMSSNRFTVAVHARMVEDGSVAGLPRPPSAPAGGLPGAGGEAEAEEEALVSHSRRVAWAALRAHVLHASVEEAVRFLDLLFGAGSSAFRGACSPAA